MKTVSALYTKSSKQEVNGVNKSGLSTQSWGAPVLSVIVLEVLCLTPAVQLKATFIHSDFTFVS